MNNQERLIEYLYGEMPEADRRDFEKQMADDPELQAELAALQQTRQWLAEWPEEKPEAPVVPLPRPSVRWQTWIRRTGIAAGILLLLTLFNARIETGEGRFVLALGKASAPAKEWQTNHKQENLLADVNRLLEQRDREWTQTLIRLDSSWQDRWTDREQQLQSGWEKQLAAYEAHRKEDIDRLAQQWRQQEYPEMAALVQDLQLRQQQELNLILSGFWSQWQQARETDLQSIEAEFVNLYRNVEQQQSETQAVLKGLMVRGDL